MFRREAADQMHTATPFLIRAVRRRLAPHAALVAPAALDTAGVIAAYTDFVLPLVEWGASCKESDGVAQMEDDYYD